jgi:2-hydroxy-3-keto-5-methylthiopentenyl-1-phosphate phosphatase
VNPWLVLIDFDGTLTVKDTDLFVAEEILGPAAAAARLGPLFDAYERAELTTLAYLEGFLRLVAHPVEVIAAAAARVPFRPGVAALLAACAAPGLEPRVISEGLALWIAPALAAAGLSVPVTCHAVDADGRVVPAAGAEPCARCLGCKGAVVRRAQAAGQRVAVVGNGASDLCAARAADLVFATGTLRGHCRREGITHTPWDHLEEVAEALTARSP